MNIIKIKKIIFCLISIFLSVSVFAQHEHHVMPAEDTKAEIATENKVEKQPVSHEEMQMQGGNAPADARDPNAYSNGYTMHSGPYLIAGSSHSSMHADHLFFAATVDKFERAFADNNTHTTYDLEASYGYTYNKLVLKAEGEINDDTLDDARTELLFSHAIDTFWDVQTGVRHDSGEKPDQDWLAVGVQGLAPYWFELDITAYVADNSRTALRINAEYELLITQRLILQPDIEINAYGKTDASRDIGSGLSDATAALRLRYEITREFAPYIGIERSVTYGKTADFARENNDDTQTTYWVAGVRLWY
jgi:copper resistance protein B